MSPVVGLETRNTEPRRPPPAGLFRIRARTEQAANRHGTFYGTLRAEKLRSFPFPASASARRLAQPTEKFYTNRAVPAERGRSSVVERQLPKPRRKHLT